MMNRPELVQRAQEARRAADYPQAELLWEQLLQVDGGNPDWWHRHRSGLTAFLGVSP